jgi:hypothetical protein
MDEVNLLAFLTLTQLWVPRGIALFGNSVLRALMLVHKPIESYRALCSMAYNSMGILKHTHRIGNEKMLDKKAKMIILSILMGMVFMFHDAAYAHVPEYLQHDIEAAQQAVEKRCAQCHSLDTALSSRAYRDWLAGIAQRHGKGLGWIPEEDAKQIFLHLIVHLEPKLKTAVQVKMIEPRENWKLLICLLSGLGTIGLLVVTLIFGHSKTLRRKWFKGHSYFAAATLFAAIFHGSYCFYFFVLA